MDYETPRKSLIACDSIKELALKKSTSDTLNTLKDTKNPLKSDTANATDYGDLIESYYELKRQRSVSFANIESPQDKLQETQNDLQDFLNSIKTPTFQKTIGNQLFQELISEVEEVKIKNHFLQSQIYELTESLKKSITLGQHWKQIAEKRQAHILQLGKQSIEPLSILLKAIPTYNGQKEPLEPFLKEFQEKSKELQLDKVPELWSFCFASKMVQDADVWYQNTLWELGKCSVPEWIDRLKQHHSPIKQSSLKTIQQGNRSVRNYYREFTANRKQSVPEFIQGLHVRIKSAILDYNKRIKNPLELRECFGLAIAMERLLEPNEPVPKQEKRFTLVEAKKVKKHKMKISYRPLIENTNHVVEKGESVGF